MLTRSDARRSQPIGSATWRIRRTASSIISCGGGGQGGVDAVHDREGLVLPRPQRWSTSRRGPAGAPARWAAPLVHDGVGQPAAHQLDGGLDVLDLDPGLRVVAGLVQHLAQHQPHRVGRPVAGVGHHQRRLREPARGHRGRRTRRGRRDVDQLVAGHRHDLEALAGRRCGDQRGLDPAAAQVLEHLRGVLADDLDADAGVALQHVGHQPRAGVEPGAAEHPEPDRARLEGLDPLHRPPRLLGGGDGGLGVRAQRVGDRRRNDAPTDAAEQLRCPSDFSSARICSEIEGWA